MGLSPMKNETSQEVSLLLRGALFGLDHLEQEETEIIENISNWNQIYNELKMQGVRELLYPIIEKIKINDYKIYMQLKNDSIYTVCRWQQLIYIQSETIKLLNENGIECVIIKGTAAGIYYPQAFLRSPGDVDLLVSRSDFSNAAKILEQNGYRLFSNVQHVAHHNAYKKNGVCIELHRWLGGMDITDEQSIHFFEEHINYSELGQIDKYVFPVFPARINGLILLLHINQHLRSGIGLKQMIDWMLFVDCCLSDKEWKKEFSDLADRLGLKKLAITTTAMCQKYLGLRKDISWCKDADMETCDELMDYVMKKGNLGAKIDDDDQIASFWITVHNPFSFFKRLQKYGLWRWEKARKYKVLRPFAWAYQMGYIIKTLRQQDRSIVEMIKLYNQGKTQGELIEKLGLNR